MKIVLLRSKHFTLNTHDFLRGPISKAEFTRESQDTKSIIHFLPSSLDTAIVVMMKLSPLAMEITMVQIYPQTF